MQVGTQALLRNTMMTYFNILSAVGESTLTDAMTAAGKTYEEIAQMVAEQVGTMPVATTLTHSVTLNVCEHFLFVVRIYIPVVAFCLRPVHEVSVKEEATGKLVPSIS